MAENEEKKIRFWDLFTNKNNNGMPNMRGYDPSLRDWEHRKDRIRDSR